MKNELIENAAHVLGVPLKVKYICMCSGTQINPHIAKQRYSDPSEIFEAKRILK